MEILALVLAVALGLGLSLAIGWMRSCAKAPPKHLLWARAALAVCSAIALLNVFRLHGLLA